MFNTDDKKAQRAAEKVEREFWQSPQGRARAAYQNGDGYFEFVGVAAQTDGSLMGPSAHMRKDKGQSARLDVLSQITDEGWRLVHMTTVWAGGAQAFQGGTFSTSKGQLINTYLFERR